MFKPNESPIDRIIRAILGIILLLVSVLYLGAFKGSVLGIVVFIVSLVLLFTAATGFCLLYKVFGVSTLKK